MEQAWCLFINNNTGGWIMLYAITMMERNASQASDNSVWWPILCIIILCCLFGLGLLNWMDSKKNRRQMDIRDLKIDTIDELKKSKNLAETLDAFTLEWQAMGENGIPEDVIFEIIQTFAHRKDRDSLTVVFPLLQDAENKVRSLLDAHPPCAIYMAKFIGLSFNAAELEEAAWRSLEHFKKIPSYDYLINFVLTALEETGKKYPQALFPIQLICTSEYGVKCLDRFILLFELPEGADQRILMKEILNRAAADARARPDLNLLILIYKELHDHEALIALAETQLKQKYAYYGHNAYVAGLKVLRSKLGASTPKICSFLIDSLALMHEECSHGSIRLFRFCTRHMKKRMKAPKEEV